MGPERAHHLGPSRFAYVWVMSFLLLAAFTGVANAGDIEVGWPLAEAAPTIVGFGASYATAEGSSTHRGVDLGAAAGSAVLAPVAATVSFVGSVPGEGGGTVTAVTLTTAEGTAFTFLPLTDVQVRRGDSVPPRVQLGCLAGEGDGSAAAVHLHVGARKGDVYLDPTTLLLPPAAASSASPPAVETAGAPAEARAALKTAEAPAVSGGESRSATARQPMGSGEPQVASDLGPTAAPTASAPQLSPQAVPASDVRASSGVAETGRVAGREGLLAAESMETVASSAGDVVKSAGTIGSGNGMRSRSGQAAQVVSRLVAALGRTWRAAMLATIVGMAALWPFVRRREEREEQPQVTTASGGSDVAAAAGGC